MKTILAFALRYWADRLDPDGSVKAHRTRWQIEQNREALRRNRRILREQNRRGREHDRVMREAAIKARLS